MNSIADMFDVKAEQHPLKDAFLRWQCRIRLIAMRENQGRPGDGVVASLTLPGESEPMGSIITVLSKAPMHSMIPELKHMVVQELDPSRRRNKALQFFSESYYSKHVEFSDLLTSTFPSKSEGAAIIMESGGCTLTFEAYNQRFELDCRVRRLSKNEPFYQATWWHNLLFNPTLKPDIEMLCFAPNWDQSSANPESPGV